jgi:hypothetical protein
MLAPVVARARPEDPLLTGVDLAGLTFGETPIYALPPAEWTEVVGGEDDRGIGYLIARGTLSGRQSVVLAFDIAASNISQRIAFPILIANIASQLVPSPLPSSVPLGDRLVYRPSAEAAAARVIAPDGATVELRAPTLAESEAAAGGIPREIAFTDTGQPGEYRLVEVAIDGVDLGGGRFVVNAGHAAESDLRPNPDLPAVLATARATTPAASASDLFDLWPLLVSGALVLLTIEWVLAVVPWRRRPATTLARGFMR